MRQQTPEAWICPTATIHLVNKFCLIRHYNQFPRHPYVGFLQIQFRDNLQGTKSKEHLEVDEVDVACCEERFCSITSNNDTRDKTWLYHFHQGLVFSGLALFLPQLNPQLGHLPQAVRKKKINQKR